MILKIFTSFVVLCFLSSVFFTQAYALKQQKPILFKNETVDGLELHLKDLVNILKPLEEEQLNSGKIAKMISALQVLASDLDETNKYMTDQLSEEQESMCTVIKWIGIFWLILGVKVIVSFLKSYLIFSLKPPITMRGAFKMTRKLIRSFIKVVIVVPVASINFILTSVQYIDCKRA